jgi:ATP-dependent Clp protease ATP-binding subunit ClpA
MFGKFSEEARKALTLAKEEMSKLNHPFVGSEHLLLGILSMKNDLTRKLKKYNLTYKSFRDELIKTVGIGKEGNTWYLYTPLLKKILERVVVDSKDTNEEITITNLFLSIINEGEGVAYRLLISLNIDLDRLYKDLCNIKKKRKRLLVEEILNDLIPYNMCMEIRKSASNDVYVDHFPYGEEYMSYHVGHVTDFIIVLKYNLVNIIKYIRLREALFG